MFMHQFGFDVEGRKKKKSKKEIPGTLESIR